MAEGESPPPALIRSVRGSAARVLVETGARGIPESAGADNRILVKHEKSSTASAWPAPAPCFMEAAGARARKGKPHGSIQRCNRQGRRGASAASRPWPSARSSSQLRRVAPSAPVSRRSRVSSQARSIASAQSPQCGAEGRVSDEEDSEVIIWSVSMIRNPEREGEGEVGRHSRFSPPVHFRPFARASQEPGTKICWPGKTVALEGRRLARRSESSAIP